MNTSRILHLGENNIALVLNPDHPDWQKLFADCGGKSFQTEYPRIGYWDKADVSGRIIQDDGQAFLAVCSGSGEYIRSPLDGAAAESLANDGGFMLMATPEPPETVAAECTGKELPDIGSWLADTEKKHQLPENSLKGMIIGMA